MPVFSFDVQKIPLNMSFFSNSDALKMDLRSTARHFKFYSTEEMYRTNVLDSLSIPQPNLSQSHLFRVTAF